MATPPRRKKPRNLQTIVREAVLMRRYRAWATDAAFDFDWAAMRHNRSALVNLLVAERGHGDYLEIGCASNLLFDTVAARSKIGVDPEQGGTHRMTSDAFFAANPKLRFDVILIDGLHTYDQARRDVEHALQSVAPGGWIALHDMLPRDWIEEHVPQISTSRWTGDVWKVAFELARTSGVEFRLLTIDHGVGVARVTGAGARLADLRADLAEQRFGWLHDHFADLPVTDWAGAMDWIQGRNA